MHPNFDLILTLTGGLIAALVFGFLTQRMKLSPIVGYLLGGVAVGPFTPGFVAQSEMANQLAEIGVILLMFGVGLHFHVRELWAVRSVALPGAVVQIVVATGLGVVVARWAGWGLTAGLIFGLAVSVASTVVLLRVLADHNELHTRAGHVAVGWLLVEDIFTVLVLVLLPILATEPSGNDYGDVISGLGVAILKLAALLVFVLFVARRAIPRLLAYVARTRSRELFTLTVLALALGLAVCSATLFGASMALGAFLAGMVIGQSEFSSRAASEALPMRDAFAVLFFVAMGMLFDPGQVLTHGPLIAATVVLIVLGKPLAALLVVLLLRYPARTAATVAIALAQIGEFSFILAALGRELELLPNAATQILVAASVLSITLNPLFFKLVNPMTRWLERRLERTDPEIPPHTVLSSVHQAIVVGHGPVGGFVVTLLVENGLQPTVIELNHDTVNDLRSKGIRAVYGDGARPEILERAGIRESRRLIYTAQGAPDAIIRTAKELNPSIRILTRATFVTEEPSLQAAGAQTVVIAEKEVALGMTIRVLEELGATADQLDRARDRVRSGLGATS